MRKWSNLGRALANALLRKHAAAVETYPVGKTIARNNYLISYGDLCAVAKVPVSPLAIGPYLSEIAEWCRDEQFPPLNALAVNATTKQPGSSYNGAGGFKFASWPTDVEACVRWTKYPPSV